MSVPVTLVAGDSSALLESVQSLIDASGADIAWEVPSETQEALVASAQRTRAVLVGWRRGGRDAGELPPAVILREALGVVAQRRIVRTVPGLPARVDPIDLVIIRETTEDLYAHLEHESIPGVFESLKVTTRGAVERIARHAMQYAVDHGRKKVTIVHKANIMKLSDGMFLRTALEVAADFPTLEVDDFIVDALCMRLVLDPSRFDVLVCNNLYGDIVADACAGLAGGRGNAPSENVTADGVVLFTSGHGDILEHAGTERANPLVLLVPALLLLRHIDMAAEADRLEHAIGAALLGGSLPVACGGDAGWPEVCGAVERALEL